MWKTEFEAERKKETLKKNQKRVLIHNFKKCPKRNKVLIKLTAVIFSIPENSSSLSALGPVTFQLSGFLKSDLISNLFIKYNNVEKRQ